MARAARIARAALAPLALATLVVVGAGPLRAASLGASLGPVVVYGSDRDPSLLVINKSDVAATAILSADHGWQLAETAFDMAVDASREVAISRVGEADGRAFLVLSEVGQAPGELAGAVGLSVRLILERPFDWEPVIIAALAALVGLAGLMLGLRRVRPWELRVRRASR